MGDPSLFLLPSILSTHHQSSSLSLSIIFQLTPMPSSASFSSSFAKKIKSLVIVIKKSILSLSTSPSLFHPSRISSFFIMIEDHPSKWKPFKHSHTTNRQNHTHKCTHTRDKIRKKRFTVGIKIIKKRI